MLWSSTCLGNRHAKPCLQIPGSSAPVLCEAASGEAVVAWHAVAVLPEDMLRNLLAHVN